MIDHDELIAISTQLSCSGEYSDKSRVGIVNPYFILYILKSSGPIDKYLLRNTYNEMNALKDKVDNCDNLIGPFMDLDELKFFLCKICEDQGAPRIILNTNQDYNNAIALSSTPSELTSNLINLGRKIENSEFKESKSFLGKIFS